jgi:hypothetical protein
MKAKTKKTAGKKLAGMRDGNPFFAVRVPARVLAAFRNHAKKTKASPGALIVEFMASTTGVEPLERKLR